MEAFVHHVKQMLGLHDVYCPRNLFSLFLFFFTPLQHLSLHYSPFVFCSRYIDMTLCLDVTTRLDMNVQVEGLKEKIDS